MYSEFAGSAISVFYIGCSTRWDAPEECYEIAKQPDLSVADPIGLPCFQVRERQFNEFAVVLAVLGKSENMSFRTPFGF